MSDAETLRSLQEAAGRSRIAIAALNDEILYLREQNEALKTAIAALLKPYPASVQERIIQSVRPAPKQPGPGEPGPVEPGPGEASGIMLLERLQTRDLMPKCPQRKIRGEFLPPWWCPTPDADDVTPLVRHSAFAWKRDSEGPTVVLDRSAAHLSAMASVEIAHDRLTRTDEPIPWTGRPGFYRVPWFPWQEDGTPHPLGAAENEARRRTEAGEGGVWVTHVRVQLLAELARQGRYPELGLMDAYVGENKARLTAMSTMLRDWRARIIEEDGRGERYERFKAAMSSMVALMIGNAEPGRPRTWKQNLCWRPDWAFSIKDFSTCMMWRWCDDLGEIARREGALEWRPVAIQHEDELVIPAGALELLTTSERSRGRKPMVLDPTGKTLGSWKVKS